MAKKQKRMTAPLTRRLPPGPSPPVSSTVKVIPTEPKEHHHKPQRETVIIRTTRERTRNAGGGVLGNIGTNRLLNAGASLAGGAATVVVAERAGLSPTWAGVATAGGALALASVPKDQRWKEALYAAGLGAGGLVGVQLFAEWMAKRKPPVEHKPQPATTKRQADGEPAPYVTRNELNDALSHLADKSAAQQKQASCDLLTALREEIKRVVVDMQKTPGSMGTVGAAKTSPRPPAGMESYLRPLTPAPNPADADYMRNAYGGEEERNAYVDDERNAYVDDERNAYADDERNAYVVDERNAYVDDERNAYIDEERNAFVDDERNAYVDEERNAYVEDERNAYIDENGRHIFGVDE